MAKGDGWAVKRYKCPHCNKKGLYLNPVPQGSGKVMLCMYCKERCYPSEAGIKNPIWKPK
jgi:transposase-like protein